MSLAVILWIWGAGAVLGSLPQNRKVRSNSLCHEHTASSPNSEALLWRPEEKRRGGYWKRIVGWASFNMGMPSVFLVVSLSSVIVSVTLSFRDIKLCLRTPKSEHTQACPGTYCPSPPTKGPSGERSGFRVWESAYRAMSFPNRTRHAVWAMEPCPWST